jgi:hypothetical protein
VRETGDWIQELQNRLPVSPSLGFVQLRKKRLPHFRSTFNPIDAVLSPDPLTFHETRRNSGVAE